MGTDNKNQCKHKWIFMESVCRTKKYDYYVEYIRVDLFFCEKCLEQKQVKKEAGQRYEESTPDWYK
ncbi:MAG: hypothetical protein ACK5MH_00460 [Bacteroidales bacterium]